MNYLQVTHPYVYKIVFPTKEYYYGYREANKEPGYIDFPKYQTSSKIIKEKIEKYGFENCCWEIIAGFSGPGAGFQAYDLEQNLIENNWDDPLLLNGHYKKRNEQKRFRYRKFGRENPMYGKHGKDNPNYGLVPTEESNRKRSESLRGKKLSVLHRKNLSLNHANVSGENNPKYDTTIYNWSHISGLRESCTRFDLKRKYNLYGRGIDNVVRGLSKSCKGWSLNII